MINIPTDLKFRFDGSNKSYLLVHVPDAYPVVSHAVCPTVPSAAGSPLAPAYTVLVTDACKHTSLIPIKIYDNKCLIELCQAF